MFFIGLLWFLIHSIVVSVDGLNDNGSNADLAVVLGNKVNEDGSLSDGLTSRMECALNMYNQKRAKKLFLSGGLGKEGHYEGSEMKEYLINKGVPDSVIIVDNLGNNTIATVENALQLKDSLNFNSILVVSQFFHLTRTKMLFKRRGFDQVDSVSPMYLDIRDPYSLFREFVAFYIQWFK